MIELIKATHDRKTRNFVDDYNTFGLLPGLPPKGTCPGATCGPGGCLDRPRGRQLAICYVHRVMHAYKGVRAVLVHNTRILVNDPPGRPGRIGLFTAEFERFLAAFRRHGGKLPPTYRIHWSGDCPDEDYADDLREAIRLFPEILFWGYSRSFFTAPLLSDLPNCEWYLSLDRENAKEGLRVVRKYRHRKHLHLAWMSIGDSPPSCRQFAACPADLGKITKADACRKCRLCLRGKDVWFRAV